MTENNNLKTQDYLHGTTEEIESPLKIIWKRFKRNKLAVIGAVILIILALSAIFAPIITPFTLDEMDFEAMDSGPTAKHWLGTDELGRDIFTRLIFAGRISLTVGLVAEGISLFIGVILGAISGYYGGKIDTLIMRLVDVFSCIPFLLLAITVVAVIGSSIYNLMIVIGVIGWSGTARLVRGEFLKLRNMEFVESARALGATDARLIFIHMLPNAFAPILVTATLGVGSTIMFEAALSYLGLGVQPPTPSWGNMINKANDIIIFQTKPYLWLPPGIAILLAVLSINFLGDGLRDALDPRMQID